MFVIAVAVARSSCKTERPSSIPVAVIFLQRQGPSNCDAHQILKCPKSFCSDQDLACGRGFFWDFCGGVLSGTPVRRPYTVSRIECRINFPAESEMSRQNHAAPPQIKLSHLSPGPPVALSCLIRSRQGAGGGGRWCCGGLVEGSRYRGVLQLQSHQSRYTVQLRWSGVILFFQGIFIRHTRYIRDSSTASLCLLPNLKLAQNSEDMNRRF